MYAWLFNLLPGPRWARTLAVLTVAVGVGVWLFVAGFELVEPYLPFDQSGLED